MSAVKEFLIKGGSTGDYSQGRIKTKLGLMLQRKKAYLFSELVHVHSTLAVHAHSDRPRSLNCLLLTTQPVSLYWTWIIITTYYRNNSRLTSSYVTSTFNSNCLKSALNAEKAKPDQLNLYCCFSSLSKREFFDRVSEVKAAQQLMLNVHKRQHGAYEHCLAFPAALRTAALLWLFPTLRSSARWRHWTPSCTDRCASQSRRLEMSEKDSTTTKACTW